ncbi:tetratricopeptide repeat protein [Micromonospora sp. PPF5-17]|uniref:AfsR/SARP family transcriptional regulator n=1 Tax=Micromonospora solifontis TaxID=2487138 RepID=A0ABX9WEV5_9ACTN|nr:MULTISPECIES: BTAD domain-containing putative transcriptional regulator [Micromonospora]NES37380.1 tetratricopeptide repeat protein [Micromonospora solifontis]NES58075.1 tetratricopeptide repeat protein [Micromonospora sp. PPF5-6]RNL98388.1 AfsR/SARP family transcriptional regulator [Micromonospora solifontis]
MRGYRVGILGRIELSVDGVAVPLAPLERAFVASLAAHGGRIVPVDRLIDGLWPDDPPTGARNRVQAIVASVRRGTTPELILTRSPGYQLNPAVIVDAAQFTADVQAAAAAPDPRCAVELLDRALARWRDDAFVDVGARLVDFERDRLRELRDHAVELRVEAMLSLGLHQELVPELTTLVRDRPLRERLRGQLMVALQRSGRQAEALAVYRSGARVLAEEHGIDPGPELRQLHRDILHSEQATAPRAWIRPHQLPGVTGDFVGRDKELGLLLSLLGRPPSTPGAAQVIVVAGLAGTGKTTLALRAAHESRHRFPAGCLYAELRGNTTDPARPGAVLGAFLRALGVAGEAIPVAAEERAALYRSVLAEHTMLVMLDGAADAAQVLPLLPPGGSTALITSTTALPGLPGTEVVPLDVLPIDDGLDLLAGLAGAERINREAAAAADVVELCGRLPLALRIAGVRLAEREAMTVARLRERLRDERRRLDELSLDGLDVRSSFTLGFERLPPPAARLLAVLSRTSLGSFGMWDETTEPLLEQLCRAHLLTDDASGRVRMHDLVRLHARERTEVAADEVIAWYARLHGYAERADASLPCKILPVADAGTPIDAWAAVDWFEAERENLVAAVRDLLRLDAIELAGRLACTMGNFAMMRTQHLPEVVDCLRGVLDRHADLPSPTRMSLRLHLGTAYRMLNRHAEAVPLLRAAHRDSRGPWLAHRLVALQGYSLCCRQIGRLREADAALLLTVRLCAAHWPVGPVGGHVLLTLGMQYGQYQLTSPFAHAACEAALQVFADGGDRWGEALARESIGLLHRHAERWPQALAQLRQAVAVARRLGDRMSVTTAEQALAATHLAAGDRDSARRLLSRTAPAFREMRYGWGEAISRRLLGKSHLEEGDADQAVVELEGSVAMLREIGQPFPLANSLHLLARAQASLGRPDRAVALGEEALRIFAHFDAPYADELRVQLPGWRSAAGAQ